MFAPLEKHAASPFFDADHRTGDAYGSHGADPAIDVYADVIPDAILQPAWHGDAGEGSPSNDAPPRIAIGSRGPWVKTAQTALRTVTPDGIFGPKTRGAVIDFQTRRKLEADGIVGPLTWAALLHTDAATIRSYMVKGQYDKAFAKLDSMEMLDLVDVLRTLDDMERAALEINLGNADKKTDVERLRAAIETVSKREVTGADAVNGEEVDVLSGYANLRDWPTLLPSARRGKSKAIRPTGNRTGSRLPLVKVPDLGQKLEDLTAEERAMVELIKRHREQLPDRPELKPLVRGDYNGYMYNGRAGHMPTALKTKQEAETDPDTEADQAAHAPMADGDERDAARAVWREIGANGGNEGGAGAINTYDRARFTWSSGFTAGLLATTIMPKLFEARPEIEEILLDAGVTVRSATGKPADGRWLFVNTDTGRVEENNDAIELLRVDRQLLSLFMSIAEDEVPGHEGGRFGQALANAKFDTIRKTEAGKVPDFARAWDESLIRFVAHVIHWQGSSKFQWNGFRSVATIRDAANKVIAKIGGTWHLGGRIVSAERSAIMLEFAGGAVKAETTGRDKLPEATDGNFAGHLFFRNPDKKGKPWLVMAP